jgi:hypothetical protein
MELRNGMQRRRNAGEMKFAADLVEEQRIGRYVSDVVGGRNAVFQSIVVVIRVRREIAKSRWMAKEGLPAWGLIRFDSGGPGRLWH